ncbi:SRPBCC family protein [Leptospira stimsonii]|uniref:ATPase n=1 Tax=Leptospira stimsonii TaxID=2202203 RepID=A0A4R9LCP6_9LEPT|nr:SRPBCC family protein [Leptospira stimsonii]RHX84249.1 ATPase [Leptospira stimsonii]TGK26036.1 ATPase [Leptospira stimsonii]TGM22469.1 ATPase [Leptospira stimsonii]
MNKAGNLKLVPKDDLEIVMTREFNAPRKMVFETITKPKYVRRWLLGPPGWSMDVCEIDFKVGGKYRYFWKHEDGRTMGMGGVYKEIQRPERIVHTEVFDEAWYAGESWITTVFTEKDGRTFMTATMKYESVQARDSVIHSPMEGGVSSSYERLDEILLSEQVLGDTK